MFTVRPTWSSRRAFTLGELLVALTVIGVLAGILLSTLQQAQSHAQAVQCVSNLKQWGVALNLYANDNNGYFPRRGQGVQPLTLLQHPGDDPSHDWFNVLPPYAGELGLKDAVAAGIAPRPGAHSLFVCPAAKASTNGPYFLPYAMNMYLSPWNLAQPQSRVGIDNPAQLAFLADGPVSWSSAVPSAQGYSVQARHGGRANVCFVDGHVASFTGPYLGCGIGEPNPERGDIHWQVDGSNQTLYP